LEENNKELIDIIDEEYLKKLKETYINGKYENIILKANSK